MANLQRIRTVFTGVAGTPWYSNMYMQGNADTVSGAGGHVADFWSTIDLYILNDVTWTVESEVAIINDATGQVTEVADWAGATGVGESSDVPLPFATQGLINWNTGVFRNGRQVRGKTFVPGLVQSANAEGNLNAAVRSLIAGAAAELITDRNGTFAVYSPTGATSVLISSANVPSKFAVMRSRRD